MSFQPFYDSTSQLKLDRRVKNSNKAHKRLSDKANDKINSTSRIVYRNAPSKKFYDLVRRDYHESVYNWQSKNNKIADRKERKKIYNDTVLQRVAINKEYNDGEHIPRKFRK